MEWSGAVVVVETGTKTSLTRCRIPCARLRTRQFFHQQQNFAMGSSAQISSGAIRCSFNTRFRTRFRRVLAQMFRRVLVQILSVRFRRVPVKIPAEAPEGSVRFRRVPVQIRCDFRCRYLVRFRRVTVQILG